MCFLAHLQGFTWRGQVTIDIGQLPISKVHGGHDPSFGHERLHQIIDEQQRTWEDTNL